MEESLLLLIGDDWAEDHHDVELQEETGRKLAAAKLPEGVEGIARLHELVAPLTTQGRRGGAILSPCLEVQWDADGRATGAYAPAR